MQVAKMPVTFNPASLYLIVIQTLVRFYRKQKRSKLVFIANFLDCTNDVTRKKFLYEVYRVDSRGHLIMALMIQEPIFETLFRNPSKNLSHFHIYNCINRSNKFSHQSGQDDIVLHYYIRYVRDELDHLKTSWDQFIDYVKIPFNLIMFLEDIGRYDEVNEILVLIKNVIDYFNTYKCIMPPQISAELQSLYNTSVVLELSAANSLYDLQRAKRIFGQEETISSQLNCNKNKSELLQFLLECSKYQFTLGHFIHAENYLLTAIEVLNSINDTNIPHPTIVVKLLCQLSKISSKLGKMHLAKLSVEIASCIAITALKEQSITYYECKSEMAMHLLDRDLPFWGMRLAHQACNSCIFQFLGPTSVKFLKINMNETEAHNHLCLDNDHYIRNNHWPFHLISESNRVFTHLRIPKNSLLRAFFLKQRAIVQINYVLGDYSIPNFYPGINHNLHRYCINKREIVFTECESDLLKALEIMTEHLGNSSYEMAVTLIRLGHMYLEWKPMSKLAGWQSALYKSIDYLQKGIEMESLFIDADHYQLKIHESILAMAYFIKFLRRYPKNTWPKGWIEGDEITALMCRQVFLQTIDKLTELYNPTHPHLGFCYDGVEELSKHWGDTAFANQYHIMLDTWHAIREDKVRIERETQTISKYWLGNDILKQHRISSKVWDPQFLNNIMAEVKSVFQHQTQLTLKEKERVAKHGLYHMSFLKKSPNPDPNFPIAPIAPFQFNFA